MAGGYGLAEGGMMQAAGSISPETAYEKCLEITRREAKNFYYGIRLLGLQKRRAMAALYALARRIDDIGDGNATPEENALNWRLCESRFVTWPRNRRLMPAAKRLRQAAEQQLPVAEAKPQLSTLS